MWILNIFMTFEQIYRRRVRQAVKKGGYLKEVPPFKLTKREKGDKIMANNRIAYGLAKRYGIDTTGKSPKEVWDALREKGLTEKDAAREYREGNEKEREKLEKRYGGEIKVLNDKINIQLFSAKLSDQKEKELKKSERSYLKQIKIHEDKIANPRENVKEYDKRPQQYKDKIIVKWKKDIKELKNRLEEVRRRLNGKRFDD